MKINLTLCMVATSMTASCLNMVNAEKQHMNIPALINKEKSLSDDQYVKAIKDSDSGYGLWND